MPGVYVFSLIVGKKTNMTNIDVGAMGVALALLINVDIIITARHHHHHYHIMGVALSWITHTQLPVTWLQPRGEHPTLPSITVIIIVIIIIVVPFSSSLSS